MRRYNPDDPFGRMPKSGTRAGRVRLLAEAAEVLAADDSEAAQFVAEALRRWLVEGGDLVGDHLKVRAPRGSHRTPQALADGLIGYEGLLDRLR